MSSREMTDVVTRLAAGVATTAVRSTGRQGGIPAGLGLGEDGRNLIDAVVAPHGAVDRDQLHRGVIGEDLEHLFEPARISVGVVASDEVTDALAGYQLPEFHRPPSSRSRRPQARPLLPPPPITHHP